ncbi:MAG: ATP-grasp domain-containing protein, partial [Burkholderiales bacterium]
MIAAQPILPPAMLGVIGGGQLGMFFAQAALKMGYTVAVLDPDPRSPAMAFATEKIIASYEDESALERMARLCAAVTVEFESVPAGSVRRLESTCFAAPRADAIAVVQDRILEKNFLRKIGLPLAPYQVVLSARDLDAPDCYPGILKLARQSYDGKGQAQVANARQARAAWIDFGELPCVIEKKLSLEREFSVVIARSATGQTSHFPIAENLHTRGILELSVVPAELSANLSVQAVGSAKHIAFNLDYVGVLAVEYFLCEGKLLVNEIAPRPHNSG